MANVEAGINYIGAMATRPRFYAQDHSKDILSLEPHIVKIEDVRGNPPTLAREGFTLVPHKSAVADFRDDSEVARIHTREIEDLILSVSGADAVSVTGRGVLRFAEKSPLSGKLFNSLPARFIHIDISDSTAAAFSARSNPKPGETPRRACHYNVWRVISDPPQDVPLSVCDARSLTPSDLTAADAMFDAFDGQPEWSFEALLIRFNPRHRWCWFPDMTRNEALIFKTNDSDLSEAHHVPHSAFDNPLAPADTSPRASIEMRAIAYWY